MAVTKVPSPTKITQQSPPVAPAAVAPAPQETRAVIRPPKDEGPKTFDLELTQIQRYYYGTLYLKGVVYTFSEEDARHLLSLKGPNDIPVFKIARQRMKTIRVPVESRQSSGDLTRADLQPLSILSQPPRAVEAIVIEDDDPVEAERLRQIDAGEFNETQQEGTGNEIDTANAVKV